MDDKISLTMWEKVWEDEKVNTQSPLIRGFKPI